MSKANDKLQDLIDHGCLIGVTSEGGMLYFHPAKAEVVEDRPELVWVNCFAEGDREAFAVPFEKVKILDNQLVFTLRRDRLLVVAEYREWETEAEEDGYRERGAHLEAMERSEYVEGINQLFEAMKDGT